MIRALLALLVGTSIAAAQPAPQTAAEHYEQSKRYYAVDEFDKAIAELKTAYTMAPDPVYLFNIAQALRKKGDCTAAIEYYRRYLRDSPKAPNRATVESLIKELEPCAAAQPRQPDPPVETKPVETKPVETKPVETKPVVTIEPPAAAPVRKISPLRIAGLAVGSVGGVMLIGGGLLALDARSIQNGVESRCNSVDPGCDWTVERDNDERGQHRATQAKILLGAGSALVVGGIVMFVVGKPRLESPVAVLPVDGGGMVVTSGRF